VAERFAANSGCVDGDLKPFVDFALADHVFHPLGPQGGIFFAGERKGAGRGRELCRGRLGRGVVGRKNRFARHF